MKKHLIIFMALLGVTAVSCKKDKQKDGYMNATVNGQSYKSTRVNAHFPASSNKGILTLSSSADGGRTITLAINNYKGVGTYKFKSDNIVGQKEAVCTYSYMRESDKFSVIYTTEDADDKGYITITREEGNTVEGTFQFRALHSPHPDHKEYVEVTNGSFSMFF